MESSAVPFTDPFVPLGLSLCFDWAFNAENFFKSSFDKLWKTKQKQNNVKHVSGDDEKVKKGKLEEEVIHL